MLIFVEIDNIEKSIIRIWVSLINYDRIRKPSGLLEELEGLLKDLMNGCGNSLNFIILQKSFRKIFELLKMLNFAFFRQNKAPLKSILLNNQ